MERLTSIAGTEGSQPAQFRSCFPELPDQHLPGPVQEIFPSFTPRDGAKLFKPDSLRLSPGLCRF